MLIVLSKNRTVLGRLLKKKVKVEVEAKAKENPGKVIVFARKKTFSRVNKKIS